MRKLVQRQKDRQGDRPYRIASLEPPPTKLSLHLARPRPVPGIPDLEAAIVRRAIAVQEATVEHLVLVQGQAGEIDPDWWWA